MFMATAELKVHIKIDKSVDGDVHIGQELKRRYNIIALITYVVLSKIYTALNSCVFAFSPQFLCA